MSLDLALGMLKMTRATRIGLRARLASWLGRDRQQLVCADIERLPLASASAGLEWSNLALQWCNELDLAFAEAQRVLQPGGLFMFSTLGPDTLKELRAAAGSDHVHVSRFIDMHDIGDALVRAGFSAPVLDVERFTLTYDDALSAMRDLKAIGAHNAAAGRPRGLGGRGFLQRIIEGYEPFRQQGKLPATYEVVYGHAWKAESAPRPADGGVPVHFHKRG
jgi:malonyl-CoA O-methyltransferase